MMGIARICQTRRSTHPVMTPQTAGNYPEKIKQQAMSRK
jgi:hypothetical protein